MDARKYISEILGYYKYKVDNNLCTMGEIDSVAKALEANLEIEGTISDFAQYFDVSEGNIRATISRKLFAKPKRRVFYPLLPFLKIIPERWRKRKSDNV